MTELAERRMFAKSVIESDVFLDLPISARLLYFDLGMRGDDDGFVDSPKLIMRVTGASDDDLKLLIAKQFLVPFKSGVVVVRHWKIHNYIRVDRYKPTQYQQEKSLLSESTNGVYCERNVAGIPVVYQASTNCLPAGCIGEGNKGEVNIGEDNKEEGKPDADAPPPCPHSKIINLFNSTCKSYPQITKLSDARKKAIKARFKQYSIDDFKKLFEIAENSAFLKGKNNRNWSANFDWLIADRNMAKVLDGNYSDDAKQQKRNYDSNFEFWEGE